MGTGPVTGSGSDPYGGPGRRAVAGSLGMHILIIAVAWVAAAFRPAPIEYETVMIQLVSPPPAQAEEVREAAPEEELEIETPDPTPVQEEAEVPLPAEEETPPPPEPAPDEPEEDTPPTEETEAAEESDDPPDEETGQDLNVRLEGLQRDYPEYWEGIISQIDRCFRGSTGRNSAVVRFTIHRDGTVSDLDVVESSGSLAFEVAAIEAVECAGRGRFGPLPADFQYETLPVLFSFRPRG